MSLIGIFNDKFRGGGVSVKTSLGGNVISNWNFELGDTAWAKGVNWEIVNDGVYGWVLWANGVEAMTNTHQVNALQLGVQYRVEFDIVEYISGSMRILVGDGGPGIVRSAVGHYVQDIVCSLSLWFYVQAIAAGSDFKIDNIIARPYITIEEDE